MSASIEEIRRIVITADHAPHVNTNNAPNAAISRSFIPKILIIPSEIKLARWAMPNIPNNNIIIRNTLSTDVSPIQFTNNINKSQPDKT